MKNIFVKDNISIKGRKCSFGSEYLKEYLCPFSSSIIEELQKDDEYNIKLCNDYADFSVGIYENIAKNIENENDLVLSTDTFGGARIDGLNNELITYRPSYGIFSRYGILENVSSVDTISISSKKSGNITEFVKKFAGEKKRKDPSCISRENFQKEIQNKEVDFKKIYLLNSNIDNLNFDNIKNEIFNNLNLEKEEIKLDKYFVSGETFKVFGSAEYSSNSGRLTGLMFGEKVAGGNSEEITTNFRTKAFSKNVKENIFLGMFYLLSENVDKYFKKSAVLRKEIQKEFQEKIKNDEILVILFDKNKLPKEGINAMYTNEMSYASILGLPSVTFNLNKDISASFVVNRNLDLPLLKFIKEKVEK